MRANVLVRETVYCISNITSINVFNYVNQYGNTLNLTKQLDKSISRCSEYPWLSRVKYAPHYPY